MVGALSGRCTGTVVAAMKAAVLLPSFTLPPVVASSLACEAITDAGFTNSLMTKAASVGPVEKMPPMFITTSSAPKRRRTTLSCRSEEHTSELPSLMRTSYAVFSLIKKNKTATKFTQTSSNNHKSEQQQLIQ